MNSNAENIEDAGDPLLRVFMNSFIVSDDLPDEDAEAYIEYTFSGGVDYEYVIKFEYGAPGGDNVVMLTIPPEISPAEEEEDDGDIASSSSTEGFFGQRTQSIIYITVGVLTLIAVIYFFLL